MKVIGSSLLYNDFGIKLKYHHLILLSLLSALLLIITIPVKGIPWFLFIAFIPLFIVEDYMHQNRSSFRKGAFFLCVFITFLVWNSAGSWWLKNASVPGAVMAVLVNTLLMSLIFQLFHGSRKGLRNDALVYPLFISYWIGWEYFHHNWDLTYPWFSLGNVFSASHKWVQWYEYTGVLGGTLWIIVGNVLILSLIKRWLKNRKTIDLYLKRQLIIIALWFVLPSAFSLIIYNTYDYRDGEKLDVVLVQPNNDPYKDQYTIGALTATGNFIKLAEPLADSNTMFIVGPESMIQENIWERHLENSVSIDSMQSYINRAHDGLTLIVGASSFKMIYNHEDIPVTARELPKEFLPSFAYSYNVDLEDLSGWYNAYNTGLAIDRTGITGLTHKSKLVAGVERMPFKKFLSPLLGDLALDLGGTVGTLAIDENRFVFDHTLTGHKYGVAICYESVFGEFFARFVKNGAELMFIITNDGWWGDTPGHRQHNAFASLRAIETRRDIARSANTGITCFINQRGDILQPTEYWTEDAIKGVVVPNDKITIYVKYGDYIGRISLFVAILLLLITKVTAIKLSKQKKKEHLNL